MLQGRVIYDNAVNVKDHEFRMELDAVERLRHHSMEMQRNIEVLVETRDHAREEAIRAPQRRRSNRGGQVGAREG